MERDVGICSTCGGAVTLRLSGRAREARCGCGASAVPASFFAANQAMNRGPIHPFIGWPDLPREEVQPWQGPR
jgi:hypothetical protein